MSKLGAIAYEAFRFPFRVFCLVGLHSYWEFQSSRYSKEFGQFVILEHSKECSICDKKINLHYRKTEEPK